MYKDLLLIRSTKQRGYAMKNNVIVALAVAVILLVAAFAIYGTQQTALVVLPEKQKMAIGHVAVSASLPVYIAEEKGFFDEEGIDAEIVNFSNSNDMLNALVSGQLDATASISYIVLTVAYSKEKEKFRIYLSGIETPEHYNAALLVRPDSDIILVGQIEGKTIVMRTGSADRFTMRLMLKKMGINPDNVELIQVEPSLMISTFAAGQGDVLWALEPSVTKAVEEGLAKMLVAGPRPKYIVNPYPVAASVISTEFASRNPEAALAFKKAVDRAVDYIRSNEAEARKALPKYTPIDEETALKVSMDMAVKLEEVNPEEIQQYVDMLWREQIIDSQVDITGIFWEVPS